jgi:hypothetical protein
MSTPKYKMHMFKEKHDRNLYEKRKKYIQWNLHLMFPDPMLHFNDPDQYVNVNLPPFKISLNLRPKETLNGCFTLSPIVKTTQK